MVDGGDGEIRRWQRRDPTMEDLAELHISLILFSAKKSKDCKNKKPVPDLQPVFIARSMNVLLTMSFTEIVDLSSDDELGVVDVKSVKLEPGFVADTLKLQGYCNGQRAKCLKSNTQSTRQESEEIRSSNALSTGQSSISMLEQGQSLVDDTSLTSSATVCPAPLCRQFWKAGNYEDGLGSKVTHQNGKNYLHVHPMFLHSNATSHKWAFGAIAELLDNAVDEIQNGATFVIVDKTSNPRDGSPALLIQDDGGGMDAEAMRRCMSFGFSDRKSKSSIGKYGNGFKTSSMRLGADVIVFSRCVKNRILSQSVGLLSYTFLSQTGHDRIVVPMVDYEFNALTGTLEHRNAREHYTSNLSMLLQWSPYHTEAELLKQFNDVGAHGTKVIIYNLWFNDDGTVELDFDTDPEDICIGGDTREVKQINDQHIAYRLRYSLRQYLSILYLRMPQSFNIILRGRVVEHHNIANDLKYPEFILYKPQSGGCVEGEVITTIGFLKEAPQVNIQGFNVYHKNRLILPFWQVVSYSRSRGRGVVGVLEANFIEPTHNKQDFERTTLFQKLEGRLKEMTLEYWDFHCEYIGYQATKKPRAPMSPQVSSYNIPLRGKEQPVMLRNNSHVGTSKTVSIDRSFHCPAAHSPYNVAERVKQLIPNSHGVPKQGSGMKRKEHDDSDELEIAKMRVGKGGNVTAIGKMQPSNTTSNHQEVAILLEENKKLQAMCTENEQREKELHIKAMQLRSEVEESKKEYSRLLAEMQLLDPYMDMDLGMDMYYNVNV